MTKRFATHNVLRYESLVVGNNTIGPSLKFCALKKSVKDLIERGRVVLSADYDELRNPYNDFVLGRFAFDIVYLGRKAVHQKGIRHHFREKYREFISQPISIPY